MRILLAALLFGAAPASARLLLGQEQALALAFPETPFERRTAYLSEEQLLAARKLGRVKIDSSVWTYYAGLSTATAPSRAYFDTHLVRTAAQTVMVVVGADGRLRFVELLSFLEPPDYAPSPRWLRLLSGRRLEDDLAVGRALRNMAGSTLTAQALADSVRRVLAVDAILRAQKATIEP